MRLFRFCVIAAAIALPSTAFAQVDQARQTDDGSYYKFTDDPLGAGVQGALGETLTVRRGAARVTLIRPRTQFVYEMFKSIENI